MLLNPFRFLRQRGEPPPSWEDAEYPVFIGHRGSANILAPENTLAAMDYAASIPGVALETDVSRTGDNELVLMHDATVDRTTDGTGTVSSKTLADLRTLDASLAFRPDLFSPQVVPTFGEYLAYGKRALLIPESKNGGTATATKMAQEVVARGLVDTVVIQSFNNSDLSAVHAVDSRIRTARTSTTQITPSTAQSLGVFAVLVGQGAINKAYVDSMHAIGVRVFAWTIDSLTEAEKLIGDGVDGVLSNDPDYVRNVHQFTGPGVHTVTPPASGLLGSGWKWASHKATGVAPIDGFATFTGYGSISNIDESLLFVPGLRLADAPVPRVITTTIKIVEPPASGQVTRWIGVRFCWSTDNDTRWDGVPGLTNGYQFALRINGSAELGRITNGSNTNLATVSWAPISVDEEIPLKIEIDETSITVTRTDTNETVTASDATHPRGGFIGLSSSGLIPAIGETTVTF